MTRKTLADMIKSRPEAAPTRAGATADYALVKLHFDLITTARGAGLSWKDIADAAEFESLAAADPVATLRSYYSKLSRARGRSSPAQPAAPAAPVPPHPAGPSKPLPPPPGAAAPPSPGDIFSNLPQLPTGKVNK